MRLSIWAVALLGSVSAFSAPSLPEKKPETKGDDKDMPFATTAWAKDGTILIKRKEVVYVEEARTQAVVVDGKVKNVTVTVMVPVTRESIVAYDSKSLEVQSSDGKEIPPADIEKLLKAPTNAIVSPSGKPVGEDLRKKHADSIVILIKPKK